MENKVDIRLYRSNGDIIEINDAENNGDVYIVDEEISGIDGETFRNVQIGDVELGVCEAMKTYSIDGRFWFAFMPLSDEEIRRRKIEAQIEYIAIMSDIDLEV